MYTRRHSPALRMASLIAVTALATPALAQSGAALSSPIIDVDPANPFGKIDTNQWYLAQYLSGRQADAERWRWVRSLTDSEKTEIRARCDQITDAPERYGDDARLICLSVYQVLNQK
jgi:hypothetical protein